MDQSDRIKASADYEPQIKKKLKAQSSRLKAQSKKAIHRLNIIRRFHRFPQIKTINIKNSAEGGLIKKMSIFCPPLFPTEGNGFNLRNLRNLRIRFYLRI
jgi:hypothetical protein